VGANRLINAPQTQDLPAMLAGAIADLRAASVDARSSSDELTMAGAGARARVPAIEQLERTRTRARKC
jgi:hypothetical protein